MRRDEVGLSSVQDIPCVSPLFASSGIFGREARESQTKTRRKKVYVKRRDDKIIDCAALLPLSFYPAMNSSLSFELESFKLRDVVKVVNWW